MVDLDPTFVAGSGAFLAALASWIVSMVNNRALKIKTLDDKAVQSQQFLRHSRLLEDVQAIHVLVNNNWSEQMQRHADALKEHAIAMERSASVIERLLMASTISQVTAESVRQDHESLIRKTLEGIIDTQREREAEGHMRETMRGRGDPSRPAPGSRADP